MTIRGRAHKLGDHINTDIHASNKYRPVGATIEQLVGQLFKELDPELADRIRPGDILVAGEAFGVISLREDAIVAMKAAGFRAVLARSFGNLFYHNAINLGLPTLECDTRGVETGHDLEIALESGMVINHTKGTTTQATILPPPILRLLADGGLIEHIERSGGLTME